MPLPIGHALAGIAFQRARPGFFFRSPWHDILFFMFLANLPDADFLPGILVGRPNLYHHGIFHSLGAALAVAAIGGWIFSRHKKYFWPAALGIFSLFSFHLLLDFFSWDLVAPYGLPLFWPLSGRYFITASPFFLNITRSGASGDFFVSLFNRHNLAAALREVISLGGLALAAALLRLWWGKRRVARQE
jgi:inner membrane protein